MVPYRSNGSARAMIARTMTSVGTRATGYRPRLSGLACCMAGAGGRAPAPGPGLEFQSPGALPYVPYEAAKRMRLGSLGLATGGPPVGAGAGAGAQIGATQGASYGSVAGPVGTAVGAIIGAIGGAIAGSINKKDPEQYNFDQAVALWQQNPDNVYAIGNKYLPLAGLFDLSLKGPHIPIYLKYGRMGEQRFVTDMINQVYSAAQQGRIGPTDTPLTIMSRIVQPWIDSWGLGPMVDPHQDLINRLMIGMILDYVTGQEHNWTARSGDYPFGSLPKFSLPPPLAVSPPAPVAPPPPTPVVVSPQAPATVPPVAGPTSPTGIPLTPGIVSPGVWYGGSPQVQTLPACAPPFLWNGTQCVMQTTPQAPVTAAPPPVVAATPPPASAVPSTFNQVATDSAGLPVFANAQGVLYQWDGSTMRQFTGQLATNSSQAAQLQAAIQQALAQGYSSAQAAQTALAQQQAAGAPVPPSYQAQAATQAATTAAAPTVTVAGVGGGSGIGGLVAVGLTVVGLLFATARPAKGKVGHAHA